MDSLSKFFEEQRAILEMSDEDDEHYLLRISGTNKRRKLSPPLSEQVRGETIYARAIQGVSISPVDSRDSLSPGVVAQVNIEPTSHKGSLHEADVGENSSLSERIVPNCRSEALLTLSPCDGHRVPVSALSIPFEHGPSESIAITNKSQNFPPSSSYDMQLPAEKPQSHNKLLHSNVAAINPPEASCSNDQIVLPSLQATRCDKDLEKMSGLPDHFAIDSSNVTTPAATPLGLLIPVRGSKQTAITKRQAREQAKAEKARKIAEEAAEKLMTPTEYAAKVQTKFSAILEKTAKEKLFLRNLRIFYVGGDLHHATKTTRARMDIIRKNGGTVASKYDPNVITHIVTDATVKSTLKALGLKALNEIPDHIPTVKWSWVVSGLKGSLRYEFLHAAFAARIDADSSKAPRSRNDKGKARADTLEEEFSRIEEFPSSEGRQTAVAPSVGERPTSRHAHSPKTSDLPTTAPQNEGSGSKDPLAEFYARAFSERDTHWTGYNSTEDEPNEIQPPSGRKSVFTCDQKAVNDGPCMNQDIVDKLKELMEIHETKLSKEDRWRVYSYSKAIRSIRSYPKKIQSYSEARTIKGVGEKTALKIKEILETGILRRIQYERTDEVQAISLFNGIYGVGPHTAHKWLQSGCRTLEDVKARKGGIVVSDAQQIGIDFYGDINSRMPRNEARDIFSRIKPIALAIDPKLFIEIMGSYRRGKSDCGDIDILITRPIDDGITHLGVLPTLLEVLRGEGILTEDLVIPDSFDTLEATYRGLCRRDPQSKRRRIDILTMPYESRGAALLYYTGDDIFNRAMRYKAQSMGYSLNQRALYSCVIRDPKDRRRKLTKGVVVASETEEEIFRILGVPWQEPHERVRS